MGNHEIKSTSVGKRTLRGRCARGGTDFKRAWIDDDPAECDTRFDNSDAAGEHAKSGYQAGNDFAQHKRNTYQYNADTIWINAWRGHDTRFHVHNDRSCRIHVCRIHVRFHSGHNGNWNEFNDPGPCEYSAVCVDSDYNLVRHYPRNYKPDDSWH